MAVTESSQMLEPLAKVYKLRIIVLAVLNAQLAPTEHGLGQLIVAHVCLT